MFTWSLLLFLPQFIPMPVLYGVFLYMGVASLNGVQVSHQPAQGFFYNPPAFPFPFAASSSFPRNPWRVAAVDKLCHSLGVPRWETKGEWPSGHLSVPGGAL